MATSAPPPPAAVLIVEDEALLRFRAVDLVEDAGFEAIEAETAEEACEILERRSDIHVVFTDIQLTGKMNGLALAELARRRWPPIEFIIVSGHLTPADDDLPERSVFFGKPYVTADVVAALNHFMTLH